MSDADDKVKELQQLVSLKQQEADDKEKLLELARTEMVRMQQLQQQGGVSRSDLEAAEAAFYNARGEWNTAREAVIEAKQQLQEASAHTAGWGDVTMKADRCCDCGGPMPSPFYYCPCGVDGSQCRLEGEARSVATQPKRIPMMFAEKVEEKARQVYQSWKFVSPDILLDGDAQARLPDFHHLCELMAELGTLLNMNVT